LSTELLISKEAIEHRVRELADQISAEYSGQEPVMVGILKGAIFFMADLVRAMTIPTEIDFIRASSYGSGTTTSGTIHVTKDVEIPLENKPVILVEDIVDTGLTLNHIVETMKKKNPKSLKICALIDKLERRDIEVHVDYCGFRVEEGFLVGCGLDFNEKHRYLPDIYILK
jgi:hypoxanthine phosphoribosyltransferase